MGTPKTGPKTGAPSPMDRVIAESVERAFAMRQSDLLKEIVAVLDAGFRGLREELRARRDELRALRVQARLDRLEARVTRLEGEAER